MNADEFMEGLQHGLQAEMEEGVPVVDLVEALLTAVGNLLVEKYGHGGAKEAFRALCQQTEESLWLAANGTEWLN